MMQRRKNARENKSTLLEEEEEKEHSSFQLLSSKRRMLLFAILTILLTLSFLIRPSHFIKGKIKRSKLSNEDKKSETSLKVWTVQDLIDELRRLRMPFSANFSESNIFQNKLTFGVTKPVKHSSGKRSFGCMRDTCRGLEIEDLRQTLEEYRNKDAPLRVDFEPDFLKAAEKVDPKEALAVVKQKLEKIEKVLDKSDEKNLPTHVVVQFNAEQCVFSLSSKTTFKALKQEACLHWKRNVEECVLKDAYGAVWEDNKIVPIELRKAMNEGITPKVLFTVKITTRVNKETTTNTRPTRDRRISDVSSTTAPDYETSSVSFAPPSETGPAVQPTRALIKAKEELKWDDDVITLSPIFHDPEFSHLDTKIPTSEADRAKMAYSFCWFLFWMITVGLSDQLSRQP